MTDPWLSPDAVARLTGARWRKVQAKRLTDMGIPYRLSATGEPLVEVSAVEKKPRKRAEWQPKFMRAS